MSAANGYDFTLTRRQRLASLAAEWWGPGTVLISVLIAAIPLARSHPIGAGLLALVLLFMFRGLADFRTP